MSLVFIQMLHVCHAVKAETQTAEAQKPYGTDGQIHSPLNPAGPSLCLTLCPFINPYTLPKVLEGLLFAKDNSWQPPSRHSSCLYVFLFPKPVEFSIFL